MNSCLCPDSSNATSSFDGAVKGVRNWPTGLVFAAAYVPGASLRRLTRSRPAVDVRRLTAQERDEGQPGLAGQIDGQAEDGADDRGERRDAGQCGVAFWVGRGRTIAAAEPQGARLR